METGATAIVGRGLVEILPDFRKWGTKLAADMRVARRQMDGSAAGLRASAATITKSLAVVGAGVGALGVGIAAATTKMAGDFQAHTAVLQTAAGETAQGLRVVRRGILSIAEGTGTGIAKLTDGMYQIEKAGFRGADGLKVLKAASQGAREENAKLSDVTNAMTSVMASYHLKATDSVRVMNAMKTAAGEGKITMEEFSGALSTVLPIASANHIAFEDIAGSMATLTQHGTSAREATHELAATIRALASPNNVASREMARWGLSSVDVSRNLGKRGLSGTVEMLSRTILSQMGPSGVRLQNIFEGTKQSAQDAQIMLKNMSGSTKDLAQQYLAGTISMEDWRQGVKSADTTQQPMLRNFRALIDRSRGFSRELKNGGPAAQTYTDALKKMTGGSIGLNTVLQITGDSTASNNERIKKVGESFHNSSRDVEGWKVTSGLLNVQLDRLKEHLQVIAIKLGTLFIPLVTRLVGFVNDTLIPAIGRVRTAFLRMLPVDQIKQGVKDFTSAVGGFFDKLSGKQPKVPHPAVAPFIDYGHATTVPTPSILDRRRLPQASKPVAPPLISYGYATTVRAPSVIDRRNLPKASKGTSKELSSNLGTLLGEALSKAVLSLSAKAGKLATLIVKTLAGLDWVDIGKMVGYNTVGFAIGFIGTLGTNLVSPSFWKKHWWDVIFAVISVAGIGKVAGALGKVFEHVPILRAIAPFLKGIDGITKPVQKAVGGVLKFFGVGFKDGFAKVFPRAAATLEREIPLLTTRIGVFLIDNAPKFAKFALDLVGKILKVSGKIVTAISELLFLILRELVKVSAKLMLFLVRKGAELVTGLMRGIAQGAGRLGGWVSDHMIRPVIDRFASAGRWLLDKGSSIVSGLTGGIARGARSISGWTQRTVINPVVRTFRGAGGWLTTKGRQLVSGLLSGATSALSTVARWARGVYNAVVGAVKHVFGIRSPSTVMAGLGKHMMSGLLKGLLSGSRVLNAVVKKVFHSPLDAAKALIKKGISVTGFVGKGAARLMSQLFGSLGLGSSGGGSGQWATLVKAILPQLGAPPYALNAVLRRIQTESGGNPNAINRWDSNAKAGHPSQGLMQTIPSTFAAYAGPYRSRGILDPLANIYAGINYAMHRYGANWISVMTRPGGYASGTGGAAPGWAWVGEKGPELVSFRGGEKVLSHGDSVAAARDNGIRLPGYATGNAKYYREAVADTGKGFLSSLTGTRAQIRSILRALESDIVRAFRGVRTSLDNRLISLIDRGNKRLQDLAAQRDAIASRIAQAKQFATETASTTASGFSLQSVGETYGVTANGLTGGLALSEKKIRAFNRYVAQLRDKGLRKDLISQIVGLGPEQGERIARLISGQSRSYIRQLNRAQAGVVSASGTLGRTSADALYDSGKQASKGFLAGLRSQQRSIEHLMMNIARSMQRAIRRALGIHSPSTVFQAIGGQTGAGLVKGLFDHLPKIRKAATTAAHVMTRGAGVDVPVTAGAVRTAPRSTAPVYHLHLANHGVVGSQAELEAWLVKSWQRLRTQRRIA